MFTNGAGGGDTSDTTANYTGLNSPTTTTPHKKKKKSSPSLITPPPTTPPPSPEDTYNDLANQQADITEEQPVYDANGREIGLNKTGDINDPLDYDYRSLWEKLDNADQTIPDLNTWMDNQGYNFYDPMARDANNNFTDPTMQSMQDLMNQFRNGPTQSEQNAATAYAEQTMGLAPGTYETVVGGLLDAANKPISDFQGMSDAERAVREHVDRNDRRDMEERATRMIDNIRASSGSVARSYAAADQAIRQINDVEVKQQAAIIMDDNNRREAESNKAIQRYSLAEQAGTISKAQYMDILQKNKAMVFQGYATQINTMMQQNQQYLQMYQGDAQAIEANISNIYKAINAEIGIDDKAMQDTQDKYQMEMAPILAQMDTATQQMEAAQAKQDNNTSTFLDILGGVATIIGIILL